MKYSMPEEKKTKFCTNCGAEIDIKAKICPKCGVEQPIIPQKISKAWWVVPLFLGILGGIIAWLANKERNPKTARNLLIFGIVWAIFWVIIVPIFLMGGIVMVSLGGARSKARDARRMSDIRIISTSMEIAYDFEKREYPLTPTDTYGRLTITQINGNLLPKDPGGGKVLNCNDTKDTPYHAIDNSADRSKYCIWACLENGKFFAVSPKGANTLDRPPTDLNCW
jgi:hypothetical protein